MWSTRTHKRESPDSCANSFPDPKAGTFLGGVLSMQHTLSHSPSELSPIHSWLVVAMMTPVEIAIELESKLAHEGVGFDERGYPVVTSDMILSHVPADVELHTIDRLCEANNASKTIGVSFLPDDLIYRRLEHLEEDILRYQSLLAVGGFDLSPRVGMNPNLQRMNLLINLMATVRIALSGVRIVPNFRIGSVGTIDLLSLWPKGCTYVAGTLGCARGNVKHNLALLKMKLMVAEPSELVIYGSLRKEYRAELESQGVPYRVFADRNERRHMKSETEGSCRGC